MSEASDVGRPDDGALLAIGRVARAHGIRGRVLVAPYDPESQALASLKRIHLGPREYRIQLAERVNLGWLVELQGVADRNLADTLRGLEVKAFRDELPPLEEGEVYYADLIGYTVVDGQGQERGVVERLIAAGAQELLELTGGKLVPLALVKEVMSDTRRIVVDAPEGLFDL
ncbi:MAG TPA: ribosome maturation factor RimM [Myxococcales bacterium]|nr:ribosome maturation factor RimM [Myxococcales bacterium]